MCFRRQNSLNKHGDEKLTEHTREKPRMHIYIEAEEGGGDIWSTGFQPMQAAFHFGTWLDVIIVALRRNLIKRSAASHSEMEGSKTWLHWPPGVGEDDRTPHAKKFVSKNWHSCLRVVGREDRDMTDQEEAQRSVSSPSWSAASSLILRSRTSIPQRWPLSLNTKIASQLISNK